ncbi:MAG: 6-bladed beta-propeller, partial [bacterium]|nr:6-bladed beta-propeller [bacterium]
KTLFPTCLLLFLLAVGFTACGPKHTDFDQKEWLNAVSGKGLKIRPITPETVTEIKEVYKSPNLFGIDDEYFYISDNHSMSIHMYSTKDFQLKHSFGKRGEGPGEFKNIQELAVYDDFIFINSPGKISFFSKKGALMEERKCPPHLIPCYPVGDNYVANIYKMPSERDADNPSLNLNIVLLNSNFETSETLIDRNFEGGFTHNFKTGEKEIRAFEDQWDYFIYKDKVYLGYSIVDAFNFFVFDADGDLSYDIIRPHPKKEIPDAVKEAVSKS